MTTYERKRNVDREWFSKLLKDHGYTQRSLAKIMGCDNSTVSLMIRGERGLNIENAKKMSALLNTPINEIYRRAGLPLDNDVSRDTMENFIRIAATGLATGDKDAMSQALLQIINEANKLK